MSGSSSRVSPCEQIRWLVWKNLLRKRREPLHTLHEFSLPLLFLLGLILVRSAYDDTHVDQQLFVAPETGRAVGGQAQALTLVRASACGCERSGGGGFLDGPRSNLQGVAFAGTDEDSTRTALLAMEHVRQRLRSLLPPLEHIYCNCDAPMDAPINVTDYLGLNDGQENGGGSSTARLLVPFPSSSALDSYLSSPSYQDAPRPAQQLDKAVVFSGVGGASDVSRSWAYSLRSNGTDLPAGRGLAVAVDASIPYSNRTWSRPFLDSGLLTLQLWLDEFIVQQSVSEAVGIGAGLLPPGVSATFYPLPVADESFSTFGSSGSQYVGLFLMLAMQWPFVRLLKQMAEEKESKLKEGLHIIGVSEWAYAASWIIVYGAGYALLDLLVVLALHLFLFPLSSALLIFLWLLGFSVCLLLTAVLCLSLFDSAKMAGLVAPVIVYAQSIPFFALQAATAASSAPSPALSHLISLLPVSAFCLGAQQLARREGQGGAGLHFSNVFEPSFDGGAGGYSFGSALLWLLLDALLIRALTVYLDKVLRRQYGAPSQKWYFPCQPSYWRQLCSGADDAEAVAELDKSDDGGAPAMPLDEDAYLIERMDPSDAGADVAPLGSPNNNNVDGDHDGVRIRSLRKEFEMEVGGGDGSSFAHRWLSCCRSSRRTKRPVIAALNDLSISFRAGEITALLGHNGAGKTTLMSVLCGLVPPTSGSARVCGMDVTKQMESIRAASALSVCPQHTVAWGQLTIEEHLRLYAALKGVGTGSSAGSSAIDEAVARAAAEVALQDKLHCKCSDLSGGQQRRLNLAMALIGDSKVIYLDEPTSGVDPASRRAVWQLLRSKRAGRVIIMSTHSLDEADELGDRVAILSRGRLKCMGSALFLKQKFGVGYSITITRRLGGKEKQQQKHDGMAVAEERKDSDVAAAPTLAASPSSAWDAASITSLILSRIPGAESLSQSGGELSFRLPLQSSSGQALPDLLDYLDEHADRLDIQGYGLSVTTLEDIFLKIAAEEEVDRQREQERAWSMANQNDAEAPSPPLPADVDSLVVPMLAHASGSDDTWTGGPSPHYSGRSDCGDNTGGDGDGEDKDVLGTPGSDRRWVRQVGALLRKRMHISRRDTKALFCSIAVPCYLIVVAVITASFSAQSNDYGSLLLSPVVYTPTTGGASPVDINVHTNAWIAQLLADPSNRLGVSNRTIDGDSGGGGGDGGGGISPISDWAAMQTALFALSSSPSASSSTFYGAFFGTDANATGEYTCATRISAPYSQPVFLNLASTALLRGRSGDARASITTTLHPFARTRGQQHSESSVSLLSLSLMVSMAFAFIPATFVVQVVLERQTRFKLLQLLSGVSPFAYWLAHAVWDMFIFCIPATLCVLILCAHGDAALVSPSNLPVFLLALLLYGLSCIPFSYVCSWAFSDPLTAQNVLVLVSMLGSTAMSIVNFMLYATDPGLANSVRFVFRLLPSYALADALFYLGIHHAGMDDNVSPWDAHCAGYDLLFMAAECVVYGAAVLAIEWIHSQPELVQRLRDFVCGTSGADYRLLRQQQQEQGRELEQAGVEDADVIAERERVQSGAAADAPIQLHELRKVFGAGMGPPHEKVAVANLSFAVQAGECFGFLGQNGAGKTTTLSMLTSATHPSAGTARLHGFDLRTEAERARPFMGLCPQHDAIDGRMTARETLVLFASIRGVPSASIPRLVQSLLSRLGLAEHADRPVQGYSGGTKRKLSVAVALIGNPTIVFLDEPSTGMDPVSRRAMWNFISATMGGRAVILTTHSMDECEALCHRIGVLRGGVLQCIGTSQQLKRRYGRGYRIELRVAASHQAAARAWAKQHLPGSREVEVTESRIQLHTGAHNDDDDADPSTGAAAVSSPSLSSLFRLLESARAPLHLSAYAVGQTSLEDIFLTLAGPATQA